MKITFVYTAQLAAAAETRQETVEVPDDADLEAAIAAAAERHDHRFAEHMYREPGVVQPTLVIAVDGKQVGHGQPVELTDGCEVLFLSPMAGG